MAGDIFRTDRAWQETAFAFRHEALAEFRAAIDETASGKPVAIMTGQTASVTGYTDLVASSIFGATLMAGLEWLVFEPEREQTEVVGAILATFSGALKA